MGNVITEQLTFVQDNPKTALVNDLIVYQGPTGFDVLFDLRRGHFDLTDFQIELFGSISDGMNYLRRCQLSETTTYHSNPTSFQDPIDSPIINLKKGWKEERTPKDDKIDAIFFYTGKRLVGFGNTDLSSQALLFNIVVKEKLDSLRESPDNEFAAYTLCYQC